MNYLAIFVLVIVVIFLLQKQQIKEYKEENVSKENLAKIKYVKENVIYICTKSLTDKEVLEKVKQANYKYVFLTKNPNISESEKDTVIYNFVLHFEVPCGFSVLYYAKPKGNVFKNIFWPLAAACINYIQMLRREELFSYFFVCMKKEDAYLTQIKLQSFELSNILRSEVTSIKTKEFVLKKTKLKFSAILNFFFVILAGSLVTANVIYNLNAVITMNASVYNVVACALIYVCYANVLSKVYSSMGKFRFIASYLFPVYIVVYAMYVAYYYIRKVVGGICVNKKKSFLISLIILLIVYVIFILLKQ